MLIIERNKNVKENANVGDILVLYGKSFNHHILICETLCKEKYVGVYLETHTVSDKQFESIECLINYYVEDININNYKIVNSNRTELIIK